jgi:uncharacterized membrane protein
LGLAGAASAQPFPERRDVTGVAPDDVLNIRAWPSAAAPILGTLAPDARGVEVLGLSADGAWARVPLAEDGGWAAARYLAAREQDPRALPLPLTCFGTEPFWDIALTETGASFSTPEGESRPLRPIGRAEGFSGFVLAFDDRGETRDLTILRAPCSDNMSNRPYGLAALVWNRGDEFLEGCCRLDPG